MKRVLSIAASLMMAVGLVSSSAPASADAQQLERIPTDRFADWYYQNPSSISDIGDPFIFYGDGAYWCIATSSAVGYRIWKSMDLVHWERQSTYAYERDVNSWSRGNFWAPEVYRYKGRYYLFYSARCKGMWDSMRIGIAVSDVPQGPYIDMAPEPLFDPGYSVIDASFFVDEDGTPYLYYARDCSENLINGRNESHIYGVKLTKDLTALSGDPVLLTQPDQLWEMDSGPNWLWNEGPVVRRWNGKYWLFYSANFYASKEYGVGVASADDPLGPFQKADANPLLSYVEENGVTLISGTGHNSFFTVGDETFIVYHTHTDPINAGDDRQMALDRIGNHINGTPFLNAPTLAPQLRPLSMLGLRNVAKQESISAGTEQNAAVLADGDCGISTDNAVYGWTPQTVADAWITFRWEQPVKIQAVLLYARSGTQAAGRIIVNNKELPFDFNEVGTVPGACLRLHFQPQTVNQLRIEINTTLFEVIILE